MKAGWNALYLSEYNACTAVMAVILVRGTGDVGSAVAHALFLAGHAVLLHDRPLAAHSRRGMAFVDALYAGQAELEGVLAKRARTLDDAAQMLRCNRAVAVLDSSFEDVLSAAKPQVLVDARMRKREAPERQRGLAPLTIGLGPNFIARDTVDVVVETAWGERLGALIREGSALAFAGEPRSLGGYGRERFIYASKAGVFRTSLQIGAQARAGEIVGFLEEIELRAPLSGRLRGLAQSGARIEVRDKIVEIDPRRDAAVHGLGERPRKIAEGVLSALSPAPFAAPAWAQRINAFTVGTLIAVLAGLIGLGGAELRLPALIALFGMALRSAIMVNIAVSLVTVLCGLAFRIASQGGTAFAEHWLPAVIMLGGSLVGAWFGAGLASTLNMRTLNQTVSALLIMIAVIIMGHAWFVAAPVAVQDIGVGLGALGFVTGVAIGGVASVLGIAGGELLIPTLVLIYSIDVHLAGTLSLAISLPTLMLALLRFQRTTHRTALTTHRALIGWMAAGSVLGAFVGTALLGHVSSTALSFVLGAVLLFSALRFFRP